MSWRWLDTFSYQNRLRHLSPVHKLLFGIMLLVLAITGHALVQVIVFFWMGLWVVGYARIPLRHYLFFFLLPLAFFAAGLPVLLIDVDSQGRDTVLAAGHVVSWAIGTYRFTVSLAAVQQVLALFCRTLASLACFSFILFTIPFSEILQVMRKAGIPALVTDLLMIMYRFIFVLLETSAQLLLAQRSRGGHQGFRAGLRDMGLLATQLFVRSMHRYDMLHRGMAARGMGEHVQVQSARTYIRSPRYEWESAIGCLVLVGIELGMGEWRL